MPPPLPASNAFDVIANYATALIHEHGLDGWRFAWNRRKTCMGLCRYECQTIELSSFFVARNPIPEIHDTILHEIAHALVGPGHGHDEIWEAKCREVGAVPRRCGQANMPLGAWQAICPGCARLFHRHRRPRRGKYYCTTCGTSRGALAFKPVGSVR
jgi:predicted SprT family Zn-dependent metalloprotease